MSHGMARIRLDRLDGGAGGIHGRERGVSHACGYQRLLRSTSCFIENDNYWISACGRCRLKDDKSYV